jgi:hypothetical protein
MLGACTGGFSNGLAQLALFGLLRFVELACKPLLLTRPPASAARFDASEASEADEPRR